VLCLHRSPYFLMGVCLDGLCGDERESILGITKTTPPEPIFENDFFSCLKERGERGVWFKEWFTQESIVTV
jgi:hypothetical protein